MIDGMRLALVETTGFTLGVNYGWNKVRFPAPVPAGSRVRATAEVISVDDVGGGWFQQVTRFTVEVEGNEKPCCVADSVGRALTLACGSTGHGDGRRRCDLRLAGYLTVSVPSMPASRCPGTLQ